MKFPQAEDIAPDLRAIDREVEGECDVRLQVYDDGDYAVRWGLSDYDQDHRGFWGASSVPRNGELSEESALEIARDLIEQADAAYWSAYEDQEELDLIEAKRRIDE